MRDPPDATLRAWGRNRNKVETAIVLVHRPSRIVAEATERRSQGENLRAALFRLRLNLALDVRRPVGPDEPPSPLWASRRAGSPCLRVVPRTS